MSDRMTTALGEGVIPGLVEASMLTSDGVRLDADIWMPPGEEQAPVLLMRQAYGRRLGSALCYAHPAWYARQGFIVVVQDVRGRGTSEGDFTAFVHEASDGAEAIEWAAALPRSNGRVGLYGFSYQGTNQLLAAGLRPPALRVMAPAMIGWDLFADWASEDGALRLAPNIGWGIQMAAGTAEHCGDRDAWEELFAASSALPLNALVNARPPVLERHRALGHYHDWLERPASDPYWTGISPSAVLPELRAAGVPALFVGGWFDTHLPGTLAGFDALGGALMVGPWTHFPWDRHVANRDFGPAAVSPVDRAQVRWFRRWLLDDANAEPLPPISLFDMGSCEWRTADRWPDQELTWHLGGEGLASVDGASGTLGSVPLEAGIEYIVHDPWRPAPSVGGAFGTPPGPVNRARVDNRTDVLTFTTAPLEDALTLFGDVSADIAVVSDSPAFDLACILSRIDTHGETTQIAEGYRSLLDHRAWDRITISLRKTCATLRPGERLRLSIAAAAFPAYPVNPGTGRRPSDASRSEARLVTIGIITGGADGSLLRVSLTPQQESQDHA